MLAAPAGEFMNLEQMRSELLDNPRFWHQFQAATAQAATHPNLTVVEKAKPFAREDVHDYVSHGPYWWPDPQQPEGLPYIRRDGEINPTSGGDRPKLETLQAAVAVLAVMSQIEKSEEYPREAARLLRCWFLDPKTRMNPHLRFSQGIPGVCEGRGIGIIDTWGFCFLVDHIQLLEFGQEWTQEVLEGVKDWFSSYLDWLLQSPEGQQECEETNNHGTWYDAQVVAFAWFCGRQDICRSQIENHTHARIGQHFQADGSQPHELHRTLSKTYCTFNLLGFAFLAQVASRLGMDLWNWESTHGGRITQGVRWMLPYFLEEKTWTWPQIAPFHKSRAALLLEMASTGTGSPKFSHAAKILSSHPWDRISAWELSLNP